MQRSFLLWLRLALAGLRRPGPEARRIAAESRPEGALIWLVLNDSAEAAADAALLARRLNRLRPQLNLIVTTRGPIADSITWPQRTRIEAMPENTPASMRMVLDGWRPDLIVLIGNDLPAALICAARSVPILLVDVHLAGGTTRNPLLRNEARSLLRRVRRVLVRDAETSATLLALGVDQARVEIGGVISDPPDPLPCSDAERSSIAQQMRARPVWLAASVPEDEIATVIAAHAHALRLAHRMLLILAPDATGDATVLADKLNAEGWVVGRRSLEGEPDEEMQIFLADDAGDYGLWYRLAPVTYMGGTLGEGAQAPRSPLEPAALGSAIVHGPNTAPHAAEFARLSEARAARAVMAPGQLGEAVAELIAPDRAAILAHNAWAVTSGGAGAVEATARAIVTELDRAAIARVV